MSVNMQVVIYVRIVDCHQSLPSGCNRLPFARCEEKLFIFEHFDEIIGSEENALYLGRKRQENSRLAA